MNLIVLKDISENKNIKFYENRNTCDHAGFTHKENLKNYLKEKGIEVNDFGCYTEESVVIQILLMTKKAFK